MRYWDGIQGSQEWHDCRLGRITSSRMEALMAVRKKGNGELAARGDYREELVAERITSKIQPHFVSEDMRWGTEYEPIARSEYERVVDEEVDLIGFIFHPRYEFWGSSPDGLIGGKKGVELKCPRTITHLRWKRAGVCPPEHYAQVQSCIACAEVDEWAFMSFDPRIPKKEGRRFIVPVYRDDKYIARMEEAACRMHAEVDYDIMQLGEEGILPPIEAFLQHHASTEDFIGDLMAAMDGADSTEGNMIP